jgi:ADP-ribose pyrophosphatase
MKTTRIVEKKQVFKNQWVTLEEKTVLFAGFSEPYQYYSLRLPDYVCVVAQTVEGRFPLVRQYRPAVERFTREFPSGTIDNGENPAETARRELSEETGFRAEKLFDLGQYMTDVGRLDNAMHGFYAKGIVPLDQYQPEPGLSIKLATFEEIEAMITHGEFNFALHLTVWESFLRKFRRAAVGL